MSNYLVLLALFSLPCRAMSTFHLSQYGQDKFVNEQFFKNKKSGVFIDIGAHDGLKFSNSFFFEKKLGWKGICVEPNTTAYKSLEKNRDCICIHGGIADFNGEGRFLKISGYCEQLSGFLNKYDPRHLERVERELAKFGGEKEIITITCYKLNDLLKRFNMYHVDYLSIDTEGGELDILQSIDFDRFAIDIIDVENNYKDDRIKKFLQKKGYTFVRRIQCDEIYKRVSK